MKKSYSVLGVLIIIIAIVLIATHKPANAPAVSTTADMPATPAPMASADRVAIHVKKGGASVYYFPTTTISSEVRVDNPHTNTIVPSPFPVSGSALSSWFADKNLSVMLTDATGKVLARGTVAAESDYMTEGTVPFLGSLTFPRQPTGATGVFILKADNPTEAASKTKWIEILVSFR